MGKPRVRTAPDGIVVIDKPTGMTSHDVVARLRRSCGTRAVGHAGTLDPMATGVLVLGIERATKLLGHLTSTTKSYDTTVRLGVATNTEDADGEVIATSSALHISDEQIHIAAQGFLGSTMQVPSAVSAIKVNGVRSYKRARAGESFELPARPITIAALDVREIMRDGECIDVQLSVTCSAGTYVRAIARDLGSALGVGAHLTALRRTTAGGFGLADAQALPATGADAPYMIPLRAVLAREFDVVQLDAEEAALVRHGMPIRTDKLLPGITGLLDVDGSVLALAEAAHGHWKYAAVFSA